VANHDAFVAHMCHVVRFYLLQGALLIRISTIPSKMGDGLIAMFKHRINLLHIIVMNTI
jgi:hypothetical protein